MASNIVGNGFLGVGCKKKYAYAVNEVTWTDDLALKASLVAHELGHNMGASHVESSGCSHFIMESDITDGSSGFHDDSKASMGDYSGKVSCLRTEEVV